MVGVGLLKPPGYGSAALEKDATMSRFLNRILGLPVQLQNQLFSYFSDTLAAVVQRAKRTDSWDGGILDFGSFGENITIIRTEQFAGDRTFTVAHTSLLTVNFVLRFTCICVSKCVYVCVCVCVCVCRRVYCSYVC